MTLTPTPTLTDTDPNHDPGPKPDPNSNPNHDPNPNLKAARDFVSTRRPIVLPNAGFWRCLQEQEKEWSGARSGVYAPAVTKTRIEDMEFELPPPWAAAPTQGGAKLTVEKAGEAVETLAVGEHSMYTFGRSLTCDFQIEHPSASRMHAALCHHEKGGLYLIDLKSAHCTYVDKKPLKPYEACLLRDGAAIVFGASSRTYRVGGVAAAPVVADDEAGAACGKRRPGRPNVHPSWPSPPVPLGLTPSLGLSSGLGGAVCSLEARPGRSEPTGNLGTGTCLGPRL